MAAVCSSSCASSFESMLSDHGFASVAADCVMFHTFAVLSLEPLTRYLDVQARLRALSPWLCVQERMRAPVESRQMMIAPSASPLKMRPSCSLTAMDSTDAVWPGE